MGLKIGKAGVNDMLEGREETEREGKGRKRRTRREEVR